jgi:hypothetical protein
MKKGEFVRRVKGIGTTIKYNTYDFALFEAES